MFYLPENNADMDDKIHFSGTPASDAGIARYDGNTGSSNGGDERSIS